MLSTGLLLHKNQKPYPRKKDNMVSNEFGLNTKAKQPNINEKEIGYSLAHSKANSEIKLNELFKNMHRVNTGQTVENTVKTDHLAV